MTVKSGGLDDSSTQDRKARSPVHLPFEQLQAVDLSFRLAVAPRFGQPGLHRAPIPPQSGGKAPQRRTIDVSDLCEPRIEVLTASRADHRAEFLDQVDDIHHRAVSLPEVLEIDPPARLSDRLGDGRRGARPAAVFVLIRAETRTEWLDGVPQRDPHGFVLTGRDVPAPTDGPVHDPLPFETSLPGVFAVGDVRHGSVKRVAGAVGDGSMAVSSIHQYLAPTTALSGSRR